MCTKLARRLPVLLALFVLGPLLPLHALQDGDPRLEGLDAWVEGLMAEWHVPALGVSVIEDGELLFARGYGQRNLEEGLAADGDTLFAIGSNTKSFTATLLGMLVDEGKLDWDTPVREYLPDFQLQDPVATQNMTARDLLSHTSGLPRQDLGWYATGLDRQELYRRLRHLEPSESFRSTFQYQNLMFVTAGILAERITGETWEDLVRTRILKPLEMQPANLSSAAMTQDTNRAQGYLDEEGAIFPVPLRNIDEVGPAGSINASAATMANYVQFHLGRGRTGWAQLLSEENALELQKPQMVIGGAIAARFPAPEMHSPSYGLGLMTSTYRGHRRVGHGGGIDGFVSAMEWLPDDGIGVVVLSNTSANGFVPRMVCYGIFDRLLGLEAIDWAERTRAQSQELEERAAEAEAELEKTRRPDTSPSHDLADYGGTFEHPAYGRASVARTGDGLNLAVVGFRVPLEHFHYDEFLVGPSDDPAGGQLEGVRVRFDYDEDGTITTVAIGLEPAVGRIVFQRVE